MPRIANAFKYRAADAPMIDTALFLHLYVPTLLGLLAQNDVLSPRLLVLRGSPGSGKSSILRLFQVETLIALRGRPGQNEQSIVERLQELGAWGEDGPRAVGIYIQCDSSLRDLANVAAGDSNGKLLNALLDVRATLTFVRALERLIGAGVVANGDGAGVRLRALAAEENPPPLFAVDRSLEEMRSECEQIEAAFATLLNSFPGDPVPSQVRPHARVFVLPFIARQIEAVPALKQLVPIVMLDDLHMLYDQQRQQIRSEFVRRAAVPRWVSVRKHVYELEDLIALEGAIEERDFREIDLDTSPSGEFKKFAMSVAERRWHQSDGLRQFSTEQFKDSLLEADQPVDRRRADRAAEEIASRLTALRLAVAPADLLPPGVEEVPLERLVTAEKSLILAERRASKGQMSMFEEGLAAIGDEGADGKTEEAARLFAMARLKLPYYYSFGMLVEAANGNIEQFLGIAASYADKLIFRAEVGDPLVLSAKEQHDLLRRSAAEYYDRMEQRYEMGYALRTMVANLGEFCRAVTYRPNAPISPGVTGFGLTREELRQIVSQRTNPVLGQLAAVLTHAVAENVVFVRTTKQGKVGHEKVVFYLNRLLCPKFDLPLNTGGWQHLPIRLLSRMVAGPVAARDWGKKWAQELAWFSDPE